ncbi:MAG: glycosyltransferase family 4 protein, partial [Allobranchiibius sp.]
LRIAGDDRFAAVGEAELIAEAQRPVEHLVDLLGWVEPSEFLARVDLAVFPSIARESFGLVVAEAMSARMPFVISNSGALPEVAGPDHPFVAVAGNPEALASSIRAAVSMREDQPDHFETLLDNAQARWEQEFSPAAGRVRFLQVLREFSFSPTDQKGI